MTTTDGVELGDDVTSDGVGGMDPGDMDRGGPPVVVAIHVAPGPRLPMQAQ